MFFFKIHSSEISNSTCTTNSSNQRHSTTPISSGVVRHINRRHSDNLVCEIQTASKSISCSKSDGKNANRVEPFIVSFSDLLEKPAMQPKQNTYDLTKMDCLKTELVLDNLFSHAPIDPQKTHAPNDSELNKFNTDFYKLCSDTLNESNYVLNAHNMPNQSMSVDRFQIV